MAKITLTPAYGRDYKSKAAVEEDLRADKDFIIVDFSSRYDGKPVNLPQIREAGYTTANVRYSNLRKVAVIKL